VWQLETNAEKGRDVQTTASSDFANRVIGQGIYQHRWVLSLILLHTFFAMVVGTLLDRPFDPRMFETLTVLFTTMIPVFMVVLLFWHFGKMILHERPERPLHWFAKHMQGVVTDPDRLWQGTLALLAFTLFTGSFSFFKSAIPALHPYSWDPLLARIDALVHFGHDPYRLLMPIFGHPVVITALNNAYHVWFFLMFFMVFLACYTRHNSHARDTFLLTFVLTWAIGGNGLATLLASGGPAYFKLLGYGDHFTPLMDTLSRFNQISPISALKVQSALWDGYAGNGALSGISAMPSMHVATAVLLARYGFTYARWAGIALGMFAASIMVASVLLGWHYAIDSYVGILLVLGFWKLSAWMTAPRASRAWGSGADGRHGDYRSRFFITASHPHPRARGSGAEIGQRDQAGVLAPAGQRDRGRRDRGPIYPSARNDRPACVRSEAQTLAPVTQTLAAGRHSAPGCRFPD